MRQILTGNRDHTDRLVPDPFIVQDLAQGFLVQGICVIVVIDLDSLESRMKIEKSLSQF